METRLDIRRLDPHDDGQMQRFHEIGWRAEKEDDRPWSGFFTLTELTAFMREQAADRRVVGYCAFDGDQMVGAGALLLPQLDNLEKAFGFIHVEPELRGRGTGGALVEVVAQAARDDGRRLLMVDADVNYAERETAGVLRFAAAHGFSEVLDEVVRVLRLPVSQDRLDRLAGESAPRHEGYTLETYVDRLPRAYLRSYVHLRNQLMIDAPSGDVDFEASAVTAEILEEKLELSVRMGRTTFITVAVRDGEVVAHSDLSLPAGETYGWQLGTLVHRVHRGHRLGMATKVTNLRAVQRSHPDVVTVQTGNAETNQWMIAINVALGFEPVGVAVELKRHL
ncbi:MAG: GNAT family N-acetyltransferase [Nocardioidaceae bacterium]